MVSQSYTHYCPLPWLWRQHIHYVSATLQAVTFHKTVIFLKMKFTKMCSPNKTVHTHLFRNITFWWKVSVQNYSTLHHQCLVFGEHYHSSQSVRHKSQSSQTTAEITYSQNMSQTIKCFKNHRSQLFVSNTCRQFKESCISGVINMLLRYSS